MKEIFLYGASGHGKVIAEIAEDLGMQIRGFIDDSPHLTALIGYPVFHQLPQNNHSFSFVISIGNNAKRKEITLTHPELHYISLISPHSTISKRAEIGAGTVIMTGVSINSSSKIGNHCILNTNASIDHDNLLEDYVHISPNAALAGNVHVGEGTHIGIGACIIQGKKIGKWCTIGAGAVVIHDVPDGATVVGNPGKIIKLPTN